MSTFTIFASSTNTGERIRLIPERDEDGWTYRVETLSGEELGDEPGFYGAPTREACERQIRWLYRDPTWWLKTEGEERWERPTTGTADDETPF